jgi:hypothetical protein
MDLRAVDRDHVGLDQTGIRTQRKHLAEEAGQRVLVALTEPRDRRVVRDLVRGNDADRDVFLARALDRPRRPHAARVRVEQQRHHHRRLERRPAVPVVPIGGVERAEIHLRDRVDHKPREVPFGQPVTDVGRQQKCLLPIARQQVLAHTGIFLNAPDRRPLCNSHHATRHSRRCARLQRFLVGGLIGVVVEVAGFATALSVH